MAADFSRVRTDPLRDYAGVELKQGAVLLDSDANELVAILDRRLRALASDTLGRSTVSSTTPDAFRISVAGASLAIGKGRLYVDGLLAENHGAPATRIFDSLLAEPAFSGAIDYLAQSYLPFPPALPTAGRHLVYLDVWTRELTHLEQPDLVETAVAVETSARLQTVWQVRVLADDAGRLATCTTPDGELAGWANVIAPSSGLLSTGTFEVAPTDDPCELPPTGGYRGLENQLYRVEIHDAGQPGGTATFKWSRENASVGSRVASVIGAAELELQTLGRDDVLRLNTGDWVEIVDDAREFSQAAGEIRRITVEEATRRITFAPALPASMLPGAFADDTFPDRRNLRVRRWDQNGRVFRTDASGTPVQVQDLDAAGSTGVIAVPAAGIELLLESGITVSFDIGGTSGFKAGDYWVFAARTADASVELLDRAPPRGIHHHYARLAIWDVAPGAVTDCRTQWPPTGGDGDCGCTECVTPASHASGALTIQGAVDRVHDTGGTVCLQAGQYVLQEPVRISAATALRIVGQGAATQVIAPAGLFIIANSADIVIERLALLSVGITAACISVRGVNRLVLRHLSFNIVGGPDARGAAISLAGIVLDATIEHNAVMAPVGIRALDPVEEQGPQSLLTAVLRIDDNLLICRDSAISLEGQVTHAYLTRISGNEVVNTHDVGISLTGLGFLGSGTDISGNNLLVASAGIRCAVDGAWISHNKLQAVQDGDRELRGAGIALVAGLDDGGSKQAQVLGNQVSGFMEAAISITAQLQDLIIKQNIIEGCGNGITMADAAGAAAVSIENNHLRDIGQGAAGLPPEAGTVIGIAVTSTASATVSGNSLHRIGLQVPDKTRLIAGIVAVGVRRPAIDDNEIIEVGPFQDHGGTLGGILIGPPYEHAQVHGNRIDRDAARSDVRSIANWYALYIVEGGVGTKAGLGRHGAVRIDGGRTLVVTGKRAYVAGAAIKGDESVAQQAADANASVLGNALAARGSVPAVDVSASGELLFSDNRVEQRQISGITAVLLDAPVVIANANRVRGAGEISIQVPRKDALVAAIGNITTHAIAAPLSAEMAILNLRG